VTPQDAWLRFRGLPIIWQLAAGVAVLALVLWLAGALEGAISGVRDWAFDRRQNEVEAVIAERDKQIQQLEVERQTLARERAILQGQNDALRQSLKELGADEATINKALADDRREVEAAQTGIAPGAADPGTLLDDLRDAYPRRTRPRR
jgi:septal ring factor EnvC (AmiA/AmiB activator)